MKFKITRTSSYDKQPCDKAYRDEVKTWDARTLGSEEEWDRKWPDDPWRSKGFNHEIHNGQIRRAFFRKHWFIDFDGADGILELVDAYGSVVVERANDLDDTYQIEIYDDYRE